MAPGGGALGLAGAGTAASSLSGLMGLGWILPICGAVAAATAWLLAHQDLQAMKTGAVEEAGRPLTLLAMWLGIVGLLACVGAVVAMIWLGLSLLPSML